jgi:hypothetical protein
MSSDSIHMISRRGLVVAGAAGVGASIASSLVRALPVAAVTGGNVILGQGNEADARTRIFNTSVNGSAFAGFASGLGAGVFGQSPAGAGLGAFSATGYGVFSTSDSTSKPAVVGQSSGNNTALLGYSGTAALPASPAKTGVFGYAGQDAGAVGVRGTSPAGRGGIFKGGAAQLRLAPSTATSHPSSGHKGDLFVDSNGRLWFCKGGTTWKQLA